MTQVLKNNVPQYYYRIKSTFSLEIEYLAVLNSPKPAVVRRTRASVDRGYFVNLKKA